MGLQVLLVEDEPQDLKSYLEDLPAPFEDRDLEVTLHPCQEFDEAYRLATDPSRRFDLIVSDTYRGPTRNGDAQVLGMVKKYRRGRFCPLVVYSSGSKPPDLKETPFVVWADKGKDQDLERAIGELLDTGIPQTARKLHDELDVMGGEYLWGFLDRHWTQLTKCESFDERVCERLVRRRASIQIVNDTSSEGRVTPPVTIDSPEYYIYPVLDAETHRLGDIVRHVSDSSDVRVVLTPHCHLRVNSGEDEPRATSVLAVRTCPFREVVTDERIANVKKSGDKSRRHKKLRSWARSPSRQELGRPEGRFWFLPGFLDIPYCFCDFLLVDSLPYHELHSQFKPVATLASPFAESLQACFAGYYGSVGLPDLRLDSIEGALRLDPPQSQPPAG